MSHSSQWEAAVLYGKWQKQQLVVPKLIQCLESLKKPERSEPIRISQREVFMQIPMQNGDVPLSQREYLCLVYLVQGKTNRVIGTILGLSHRTIEYYMDNLKTKFGCLRKKELLDKILELPVFESLKNDP